MILTCEKCQSQYTVPDEKISPEGRMVRCVKCGHTWIQMIGGAKRAFKEEELAITDSAPAEKEMPEEAAVEETIVENITAPAAPSEAKKEASSPAVNLPAPHVIAHNPFGVNDITFGGLVFTLLISVSLIFLFVLQRPVLHQLPQMALFYDSLGFKTAAPGEGLQFRQMSAKYIGDSNTGTLKIDGKITNISLADLKFPDLSMVLKDNQGNKLEDWDLKSRSKAIAAGDSSPLNFELENIPANGANIEIKVQH